MLLLLLESCCGMELHILLNLGPIHELYCTRGGWWTVNFSTIILIKLICDDNKLLFEKVNEKVGCAGVWMKTMTTQRLFFVHHQPAQPPKLEGFLLPNSHLQLKTSRHSEERAKTSAR